MSRTVACALAALVVLGFGLRAHSAAHPTSATQSADERSYEQLAVGIAHGHYGTPHSNGLHWPPGAPAVFAAAYELTPRKGIPAAYWLQAVLGTLTIVAAFAAVTLAAGQLPGLVAAALVATYPPLIVLTGSLLSETLGAFLVTAALAALAWAVRRPAWWRYGLAGLLLGATVLTRADLLLAPAIAAVVVAVARRKWRPAAAVIGGALLVMTPWIAFASHRAGHLVMVTEGDGPALWVGTYLPGGGTTSGAKRSLAPEIRKRFPRYAHVPSGDIPAPNVLAVVAARHPGLSRDAALNAEARANLRRYALGQPFAFAKMMLSKLRRTWLLSSRSGSPTRSRVVRVYHGVLVVALSLLLLIGASRRPGVVMVTAGLLVAYSMLMHAVFVAKPRYNLPLMPVLIAGGVIAAGALLRRHRPQHVHAGGAPAGRDGGEHPGHRGEDREPDQRPDRDAQHEALAGQRAGDQRGQQAAEHQP
jgi:4-amino-4-deoxy-L-arabinose transferase-like glycosyltransferase